MSNIARYTKTLVAFVGGALAVAFTALADNQISAQEWVGIAMGAIGTPAAVYAFPNKTTSPTEALTTSAELDRGHFGNETVWTVVGVLLVLVLLVWLLRAVV